MAQAGPRIVPYAQVPPSPRLASALDAIFFEASATTAFASAEARTAFRRRWLDRYLEAAPDQAFVALGPRLGPGSDEVIGYLVGSLIDPALDPHQADLDYVRAFAPLSQRYPAHLHINLAAGHRSGGIGARLVQAFVAHAAAQGATGVHVVTAEGMRNVGFYLRNGFAQLGQTSWRGRSLLFLAREL